MLIVLPVSHHLRQQTLEQAEPGGDGAGNAGKMCQEDLVSRVSLNRVTDLMCSLFVGVVCWRCLLGVADGAAWRLFCPSVQLLPHPRELRTEGEYVILWNGPRCRYDCSVFCSLRFTTWPSPSSWCKTEASRNRKPDQKVVTHLLQKCRLRKESLICWWSRHIKGRPVEGNLCSPWQKPSDQLQTVEPTFKNQLFATIEELLLVC